MACEWLWGPALLREYQRVGLAWETVDALSSDDLGSSPGDATYDGQCIFIEKTAKQWHAAHELSHYLKCREDTPEYTGLPNFGFEGPLAVPVGVPRRTRIDLLKAASDTEVHAAWITVGMLIRLRLPWHIAAGEMAMLDGVFLGERLYIPWKLSERSRFRRTRALAIEFSRKYLGEAGSRV